MEGSPRSQEHSGDDDDSKESPTTNKKRQRNLGLGLRNSIDRSYALSVSEEDRGGRTWWPSFERINQRRDAKLIIPDLEPVNEETRKKSNTEIEEDDDEDEKVATVASIAKEAPEAVTTGDYYETWSPEAVRDIAADQSDIEESVDTSSHVETEERETEDQPGIPVALVSDQASLRPAIEYVTDEIMEGAESSSEERYNEVLGNESGVVEIEIDTGYDNEEVYAQAEPRNDAETEEPPRDGAESMDAILRRRSRELPLDDVEIGGGTLETEPEVVFNNTTNNYETNNYYENRNTGLHLLNYALARRRDTRDRNAAQKEFSRVDERINKLEQKSMQEIQRTDTSKDTVTYTVFERSKANLDRNVVAKATKVVENLAVDGQLDLSKKLEELQKKQIELGRSSEQVLQQAIEAVESQDGIQSEAVFESRHELKDVPVSRRTQGVVQQDSVAILASVRAVDTNAIREGYVSPTIVDPLSQIQDNKVGDTNVALKEMVTIGVWGVLVGIFVFVIFYMLTRI